MFQKVCENRQVASRTVMKKSNDLKGPLLGSVNAEEEERQNAFATHIKTGELPGAGMFDIEEQTAKRYGSSPVILTKLRILLTVLNVCFSISIVSPGALGLASEDHQSSSSGHNKLSTFNGCFVPCALNIMGIILFLRLGCMR